MRGTDKIRSNKGKGATIVRPARSAPRQKMRPAWVAVWLLVLMGLVLGLAGTALAAVGSYTLQFCAADPGDANTYDKITPDEWLADYSPTFPGWPTGPSGRADNPLLNADVAGGYVESLAPEDMILGQIVPYEMEITVTGSTAPENGVISFTCNWFCKTTNKQDFGFDPTYQVIAAFVDYGDGVYTDASGSGTNGVATVDQVTSTILDPAGPTESIMGTIQVSGLDQGDHIVVEMWVVLKDYISPTAGGNVQAELLGGDTIPDDNPNKYSISGGNQTVPLLRVSQFITNDADLSIMKEDNPDPVSVGEDLLYTITVHNPSTVTANGIVVYDTLDPTAYFVSATDSGTYDGNTHQVTWNIGGMVPGETRLLYLTVHILDNYDEVDTSTNAEEDGSRQTITRGVDNNVSGFRGYADMVNYVYLTALTHDPTPGNNMWYEPTNIIPSSTEAVVSDFQAYARGQHVIVAWETSSESNTAGFFVERWDADAERWVTVNRQLIAACFESPQGGKYAVADKDAPARACLTYRLAEIETSGITKHYGPYEVVANKAMPSGETAKKIAKGAKIVRVAKTKPVQLSTAPVTLTSSLMTSAADTDRLRIQVTKPGLYSILATDLAPLGLSAADAAARIAGKGVQLTSQGKTISYLPATDGTALYFYGTPTSSIYSASNVYWLTLVAPGTGSTMASAALVKAKAATATSFIDTVHAEQNLIATPGLTTDPESDYWVWNYLVAGDAASGTVTVGIDAPDAVTSIGAQLTVTLQGMATANVADEHSVSISLNNTYVGEATWDGLQAKVVTLNIPAGLMKSGTNTVVLKSILKEGLAYSLTALESIDLTYTRGTKAVANQLALKATATSPVQVTGLTATAWVFDLYDPASPKLVAPTKSSKTSVTFNATAGRTYLVSAASGALRPQAISGAGAPDIRSDAADYLVITSPELETTAEQLAAYRATAQSWTTAVVTTTEIYDAFSYGLATPYAIQDFIAWSLANWSTAPRYVVLAGEGSYDYQNYLGQGDCVIPPLMTSGSGGLMASDVLMADADGDGVSDVAIGRLPALNADDLAAQIAKIQAYEAKARPRSVLFVADNGEEDAGDFAADSNRLAGLVPFATDKAYLNVDGVTAAMLRTQLLAGLAGGRLLVNYVGHGSPFTLADELLLHYGLLSDLPAGSDPTVLTALTCAFGRFSYAGQDSLSEALLKKSAAGAVAVWAPGSAAMNSDSIELGYAFTSALFASNGNAILGDIIQAALAANASSSVVQNYNLLGDPALHMSW